MTLHNNMHTNDHQHMHAWWPILLAWELGKLGCLKMASSFSLLFNGLFLYTRNKPHLCFVNHLRLPEPNISNYVCAWMHIIIPVVKLIIIILIFMDCH